MPCGTRIRCLPLILVAAACADFTAPEPSLRANDHPALMQGASVTRGTGVLRFDRVHFFACVGERVHNVFAIPYEFMLVQLPNGNHIYHELVPAAEGVGTITGLTSGHVWRRDVQSSPYFERSAGGGMTHWTYTGRFVSETGPTLQVHETFHLSANAQGEATVLHHDVQCRVLEP